jgi:hypothetical protein
VKMFRRRTLSSLLAAFISITGVFLRGWSIAKFMVVDTFHGLVSELFMRMKGRCTNWEQR